MRGSHRWRSLALAACVYLSLGQTCYTDPLNEFELTVSATTTPPDPDPNGYQFVVESPAGDPMGPSVSLPSNGHVSMGNWPMGGWQVRLSDIAPNCQPAANPIGVDHNQREAAFQVTCVAYVGALDLSVTTQGTAYKSAFELTYDWQAAQSVTPTATLHFAAVPVGQRTITLSGLPPHCSAAQPSQTIVMTFGGVLPLNFDVTCASSRALDITLATTGGLPDPDGYTVTARFVVDGTPVMVDKVVAANGTVRVDELAHYPVELTVGGLAANCAVAGANPRTVTPPATGVGTETFDVDCPAPAVQHPLTLLIQAAGGAGLTIVADAAPLVCTALQCTAMILENTLVNLTFTPNAGSVVTGVTGDCIAGPGLLTATVLMLAPRVCQIVVGLVPAIGLAFRSTRSYPWNGEAVIARPVGGTSPAPSRVAGQLAASATLLVAARVPNPNNGSAPVIEYQLDDPADPLELNSGGLCGVRTMVYAEQPGLAPALYGFSGDAPWSCYTGYPPGGSIGLFNFGTTAGEALTLPGDLSHIIVGDYTGYLRRMQLGGNTDFYQLVSGQQTCPGDLALRGTMLLIVGREGTAGTSTANCNNHRGLWRFDLATNTVTGFVDLGGMPRDVALSADGTRAYVADYSGNVVHVVDVTTMTLVRSIPMSGGPVVLVLTPGDTHLLVGLWVANELRMLDLSNDQVVDTEPSRGVHPAGLVIIDQLAVLMNFGDPTPFTGTGGTLAVFEYSTGGTSSVRAGVRGRR